MPSTTAPRHERRERYIELQALETLLSNRALGEPFAEHIKSFSIDGGEVIDITPGDGSGMPGLCTLFNEIYPDDPMETDPLHWLIDARADLLTARLLRSITPEVIEESASYFEKLGAEKLAKANGVLAAKGYVEEFDAMLGGDDG